MTPVVKSLVVAAAALSVVAFAAPQEPTFRSRALLVPLDIRVVDKKGMPVTDLTAADFTILENKVPQRISHFLTQSYAIADLPEGGLRPRDLRAPAVAPENRRTFLLVLGRGRLQYPSKGADGVIHFVRDQLLPQDRVAVMAWDRATDFSTDHKKTLELLERFRTTHEKIEMALRFQMSGLAAVYGSKEIPDNLRADIDSIFQPSGAAASRTVLPGAVSNANRVADDVRRTSDALMQQAIDATAGKPKLTPDAVDMASLLGPGMTFDEYAENALGTMQDLQNIFAGIAYLRRVEGEKHLIYVSERGLVFPRVEDDNSLAAIANDARVSINVIYTGGTMPGMFDANSTAGNIAERTGGFFTSLMYADKAFDRIDTRTRFEYVLGYYPVNREMDGKYRRVDVKVNRKDVTVLFRHGYYANEELKPLDRRGVLTYTRVSAAAGAQRAIGDIGLTVTASQAQRPDKTREVSVSVMIDPSRVKFVDENDRHVATIDVSVFCGDAQEDLVGEIWQKMELRLKEETYQSYLANGIPYSAVIRVKHVADFVKVVVYDYGADLLGTSVVRVK